MSTHSVCHKCGIIGKSGQMSCCGDGGSWFENCGGSGNAKVGHTWSEGIQACKVGTQPKIIISHQLKHTARHEIMNFSNRVYAVKTNSRAAIMATKTCTFTSANTSAPVPYTTSMMTTAITSGITSITGQQDCEQLINTALHIIILLAIAK